MGGPGSGNWFRASSGTTEGSRRVDIRYLKKMKFLTPGTSRLLRWSCAGEESGSIQFRTESDRIILTYRFREYGEEWEDIEYPVYFDSTACNYGGTRKWFLCPAQGCGRRVAVLYGGKYFLCRHCHDLAYQSQSENRALRASRRSRKIIERLGGDGYGDFYPNKPKGMHWKTYHRLIEKAGYYEKLSWHLMGDWWSLFSREFDFKG